MVSTEVPVKTCTNDGCAEPRHGRRAKCLEHLRQAQREQSKAWRARQRASMPRRIPRSERFCQVCGGRVWAKDLCHSHYKTHAKRKPCSVPGCGCGMHARGLCVAHYNAAHKRKDFQRVQLQGVLSPEERFRRYVQVTDTCHIWTGHQTGGRGHFCIEGGVVTQAHRAAWLFDKGELPVDKEGAALELDHGCRVPLCVRPDHLEPVTSLENSRRQNVAMGCDHITQRDGWLLFLAIPAWQRGADNFPSRIVTTHPAQRAS
jgi:hypothetical protein